MTLEAKNIISGQRESIVIPEAISSAIFQDSSERQDVFMAPGLFDLQVNGYRNVDFNDHGLSVLKVEKVVVELLKDGVTRFFPTLITNNPEILEKNLAILRQAIEMNPLVRSCIPGIHLEGPFISSKAGFSGAHNKKWIRKPDWELFEKWQKISGNYIRLITLSPEYEGSMEFIKKCVNSKVKVAIGHSAAVAEQIHQAVSAGASLSTHLGNAISQEIHRHHNTFFDQLAEDKLFASIITDGYHLPESLIRIILRSKKGKVLLISDSTKFAGMKAGVYDTVIGGRVILDENRKLAIFNDNEFLAGSASSLCQCVDFLCRNELLSLSEAWNAASVVPCQYVNSGYSETDNQDMVLFSYHNRSIRILLTRKEDQFFSHHIS